VATYIEIAEERRRLNQATERIIGAAQKVSTTLGCGFLEKVYENALCWELRKHALDIRRQIPVHVLYDGRVVGNYVPDLLINDDIVVEIKAVPRLDASHRHQCLNYLRATGLKLGLVLNFGRRRLEVCRIVHGF
jgi:GxxExxY protein